VLLGVKLRRGVRNVRGGIRKIQQWFGNSPRLKGIGAKKGMTTKD